MLRSLSHFPCVLLGAREVGKGVAGAGLSISCVVPGSVMVGLLMYSVSRRKAGYYISQWEFATFARFLEVNCQCLGPEVVGGFAGV